MFIIVKWWDSVPENEQNEAGTRSARMPSETLHDTLWARLFAPNKCWPPL